MTAQKKVGAKILCAKGKCPKAFHVTCAIENGEVAYEPLEEVESEVVIVEARSPAADRASPQFHPFKLVRKLLVNVLCPQHNPVSCALN